MVKYYKLEVNEKFKNNLNNLNVSLNEFKLKLGTIRNPDEFLQKEIREELKKLNKEIEKNNNFLDNSLYKIKELFMSDDVIYFNNIIYAVYEDEPNEEILDSLKKSIYYLREEENYTHSIQLNDGLFGRCNYFPKIKEIEYEKLTIFKEDSLLEKWKKWVFNNWTRKPIYTVNDTKTVSLNPFDFEKFKKYIKFYSLKNKIAVFKEEDYIDSFNDTFKKFKGNRSKYYEVYMYNCIKW